MINLAISKPPKELYPFVRKIFLIQSSGNKKHMQKNVANPFTHLSFIPSKSPNPIIDNKRIPIVDRLFFIGPITTEKVFIEYSGKIDQLVIEFTSLGFYSLFGVSPSQFVNNIISLKDVIDKVSFNKLQQDLKAKKIISQHQRIIENFLTERSQSSMPIRDFIEKALELIEINKGYIPIRNLVEKLNLSDRHFRREFKKVVGVPPKTYCEILNTHYIITCMKEQDYKSMQDLAHRSNFYDVAHFCNRFKKIMGFSPTEFINNDIVRISKNLYTMR